MIDAQWAMTDTNEGDAQAKNVRTGGGSIIGRVLRYPADKGGFRAEHWKSGAFQRIGELYDSEDAAADAIYEKAA